MIVYLIEFLLNQNIPTMNAVIYANNSPIHLQSRC